MRAAAVLWCAIVVDAQTEIATPGLGMHESVYKNTKDGTRFPNKHARYHRHQHTRSCLTRTPIWQVAT